jgi:D-aminoacyl-tRNA deacylase
MRAVIQRVKKSSVSIEQKIKSSIGPGLLILLGIEDADTDEDLKWLANKIINLRIFNDENGKMNLSVKDLNEELMLISQFTLFAQTKGNNRPSFIRAAKPDFAKPMYEKMILELEKLSGKTIATGEFGADMRIELLNDGPVTIIIDTKNKE